VGGHGHVVLGLVLVELEAVLEAGTAAALDVHPQLEVGIAFFGDQLADLGRGGTAEAQRLVQLLVAGNGGKRNHAASMGAPGAPFKPRRRPSRSWHRPCPSSRRWPARLPAPAPAGRAGPWVGNGPGGR